MENNKAFIARLANITPIKGADNIVQAEVTLKGIPITTVVVGKDTEENSLIAYFDANLALEDEAILMIDKNTPGYEKEKFVSIGNYLARRGRVRCIKLRGTISNGLVLPVERLYPFFDSKEKADKILIEGYSFNDIKDTLICKKWEPIIYERGMNSGKNKGNKIKETSRIIPNQFNFHVDTSQLLRNVHKLHPDHIYSVSRKIHGTSSICSKALVKRKLSWREKFLKKIGININDTEYTYLYASRKVIKNNTINSGYYKTDIWTETGKKFFFDKLHSSETIYFEIYGYLPNSQSMIQKGYDYGCPEGECNIVVYRITTTMSDGTVIDYDWDQIKERCLELNVPMVEEYYYGKLTQFCSNKDVEENIWRQNIIQYLKDTYLEKKALDCKKKVPDEGIVIRDFSTLGIEVFKLKSNKFTLKESENFEKEVIDIEEEQ